MLSTGKISAEELAQRTLDRAEQAAHLNSFTAIEPESVLAAARRIDARRAAGDALGPLAGLPVIVKDNIDSADLPTTAGSTAFSGWQPTRNAPVLQKLLDAGAILIGKANMHEMALGVTSNNPVYGPVRNPYAPDMIAGGSSGGTAAAIAARVVTGGLGTDTGGSCRIPAALCGCVGFRPSFGRYTSAGVIPLTWTLDTPGPLARTVDDLVLLDASCARQPAAIHQPSLSGLRLAVPPDLLEDLDPELETLIHNTFAILRDAGVHLIEASLGTLRRNPIDAYQAPSAIANYLLAHGSRRSAIEVIEQVSGQSERDMLLAQLAAGPLNGDTFVRALAVERPVYLRSIAHYFEAHQVQAVLMPTTPLPARRIGQDNTIELNQRQVSTFQTYVRHTGFGSGAGLPSLSVPVGLTAAGLPVGMEIVGPSGEDGRVLGLGKAIETLTGTLPPPPAA